MVANDNGVLITLLKQYENAFQAMLKLQKVQDDRISMLEHVVKGLLKDGIDEEYTTNI